MEERFAQLHEACRLSYMWGEENVWKVFSNSASRGRQGDSLLPILILELKGDTKIKEECLWYNHVSHTKLQLSSP